MSARGQPVGLVEHHDGDVACAAGTARRYASCRTRSAYFCGSTTQTTRSTRPSSRSTSSRWPRSTESKSGRSSRTSPRSGGLVVAVERALPDEPLPGQHADPVEQPARRRPAAPQTQACATPVVGRRTPDRRELEPGERVEQAGLAAAGGAGQRDDGVVLGEREPAAGPLDQRVRGDQSLVRQVAVDHARGTGTARPAGDQLLGVDPPVVAVERVADLVRPGSSIAGLLAQGVGRCGGQRELRPGAFHIGGGRAAARRRARRRGRPPRCGRSTGPPPRRAGRRPGSAGPRGPVRPGCGSPGRRRSPRAPSARRRWCRRRPRSRRRSG